ncbi:hypothetical protein HBH52_217180 [Parastagonospora nodorum]|nr:hypothetical protein HBH52_217180 [Parastagonospora nodorum]
MNLNFVLSIAFIPNVYIADSLRARTLINPSAVSNIDLNFVPGIAFISNVYIANSLRARTLINLSAVLYEQAAAQTGLSAKVGNISLRARILINLSAVLYEQADAQSSLPAKVSIIDLDFVPSVAFNAIENVELTGDFLTALLNPRSLALKRPALSSSDLNCGRTDLTIASNDDDVQLVRDNIEELICVGKVKHTYVLFYRAGNNCNNLNIIVTNLTGREFSRVDIKSLTRFKFYKGKNIQLLRPIFKLYRKFYRLVITSKDTHCKQTIKKAYIMSLERALLILFMT